MKMFKRLAAALLAGAMALAMLTACGGGGGSAATLQRDEELEANIISWVEETAKSVPGAEGIELKEDKTLSDAVAPSMAKIIEAYENRDIEMLRAANTEIQQRFGTKKAFCVINPFSGTVTKEAVQKFITDNQQAILKQMQSFGVTNPEGIGTVAVKKGDLTYVVVILGDATNYQ